MEEYRVAIRRVTAVLLVTSVVLILPGLAGIGASVPFAVVLALAALAFAAVRETLATAPTVLDYDLSQYAPDLWIAVALGAGVVVAFPDATGVELQSLGGAAGFVAMVNYFLTPAYGVVHALVGRIGQSLSGG
ncbi:hypothetical protein SAMN05216226_10557 [Halovenus aranensis]|uniref:Uncharacterized protein n=1 Tax=Halovenus aranensis TaxID=890420 RepID=A0A1G8UQ84_9EURY|nr:hypothetical protein SAMN05216226_10557 [Halovenus aranensis]